MSDWKDNLAAHYRAKEEAQLSEAEQLAQSQKKAAEFFNTVVEPAFRELETEFQKHGRIVSIMVFPDHASLRIEHQGEVELDYTLQSRAAGRGVILYPERIIKDKSNGRTFRSTGTMRTGAQGYTIDDITKDEIIRHVVSQLSQ
jgi:hypothetical protein